MPRVPLWLQVLLAVALGAALGSLAGEEPIVFGIGAAELGRLGMLVIRTLKGLAVPLVLFTVLDAIVRFDMRPRQLGTLAVVCGVNASVALAIGLTLVHTFSPGARLAPHFATALQAPAPAAEAARPTASGPVGALETMVPKTLADPIIEGSVIGAVLIAILLGVALRRVRAHERANGEHAYRAVEDFIRTGAAVFTQALTWVAATVPIAAFGLVAQAVSRSGLGVFADLWLFLVVIVGAMTVHVLVWYPLLATVVGRKQPRAYLEAASDAVMTGIATNSSLATMPVTLRCLDRLGVSRESASLAACAGTNLNNDGILLYELMAALIIAEACGMHLGLGGEATIALAAVGAAMGIAGIPEAGLVVLPMVLAAAGLPDAVIAVAVPLVVPVDWLVARCRTVVNVMSDMVVAIVLDRIHRPREAETAAAAVVAQAP